MYTHDYNIYIYVYRWYQLYQICSSLYTYLIYGQVFEKLQQIQTEAGGR